jgi:hypothetical protein
VNITHRVLGFEPLVAGCTSAFAPVIPGQPGSRETFAIEMQATTELASVEPMILHYSTFAQYFPSQLPLLVRCPPSGRAANQQGKRFLGVRV